jgi:hypothetical protein
VSKPPGEADLRALTGRFEDAERRVRALLGHVLTGDRRSLYGEARLVMVDLCRQDFRGPVTATYLAALRDAGGGARAKTVATSPPRFT